MNKQKYIQYKSDYIKLIGGTNVDIKAIQEVLDSNPNISQRVKIELNFLLNNSQISEMIINDNSVNFVINKNTHIQITSKYPYTPYLVNGDNIFDNWYPSIFLKNIHTIINTENKITLLKIPVPRIPHNSMIKIQQTGNFPPDLYLSFDENIKLEKITDYDSIFEFLLNQGNAHDFTSYIFGTCEYKNKCLQEFSVNSVNYYNYSNFRDENEGDIIVSLATGRGIGELFIIYKIFCKIEGDLRTMVNEPIKKIRYPKKIIFYDIYLQYTIYKNVLLRFMYIMQLIFKTPEPVMCYYFTSKKEMDDNFRNHINQHHISYTFGLNTQGDVTDCKLFIQNNYKQTCIDQDDKCHNVYFNDTKYETIISVNEAIEENMEQKKENI